MNSRVLRATVNMITRLADIDINEQLRLENEYLHNENQVLTHQFKATGKRLVFTDDQRRELAIKAKALGQRMAEVVTIVRPATILSWHRQLVAMKFDSSNVPRKPGRPRTDVDIEKLVIKFAKDNPEWGYWRITGALENLGYTVAKSTVKKILKRNGLNPSGRRKCGGMTWAEFN